MGAASLRRGTIANASQLPLPWFCTVKRHYIKYHAFAFCLSYLVDSGSFLRTPILQSDTSTGNLVNTSIFTTVMVKLLCCYHEDSKNYGNTVGIWKTRGSNMMVKVTFGHYVSRADSTQGHSLTGKKGKDMVLDIAPLNDVQ